MIVAVDAVIPVTMNAVAAVKLPRIFHQRLSSTWNKDSIYEEQE